MIFWLSVVKETESRFKVLAIPESLTQEGWLLLLMRSVLLYPGYILRVHPFAFRLKIKLSDLITAQYTDEVSKIFMILMKKKDFMNCKKECLKEA